MVSILFYLKGKQQQQQPGSGRLDTRPQRTNNQGPRDDKENNTQRPKTGGDEGKREFVRRPPRVEGGSGGGGERQEGQNDERPRRPRINRPPRVPRGDEQIAPNENSQISGPQQGAGEENRGGYRGGYRGGRGGSGGGRGGYRGGARGGGFGGKREYERHSGSDKTLVIIYSLENNKY